MYMMQTYSIQQFCILYPEDRHHVCRVQPFYTGLCDSIIPTASVSLFSMYLVFLLNQGHRSWFQRLSMLLNRRRNLNHSSILSHKIHESLPGR